MYALFVRKPSIIIRDKASKQYFAILCNDLSTFSLVAIDHFTVVGLVTWPLNGSEAGGDLVLIQISLLTTFIVQIKLF